MLSTIVMIKLGKVYGNKMVDVSVRNAKLHDRALRILSDVANINRQEGEKLLKASNGSVKLSLLMAIGNLDLKTAQIILDKNDNYVRPAIEEVSSL